MVRKISTSDQSYSNPEGRSVVSNLIQIKAIKKPVLALSSENNLFYIHTYTPCVGKQTIPANIFIHKYVYVHASIYGICVCICVWVHLFFFSLGSYTIKRKKMLPFIRCKHYPCNISNMILWLNPGKNVKNARLTTCFSSKNTTVLINCSTWRRLFNMMYIFVLVWD